MKGATRGKAGIFVCGRFSLTPRAIPELASLFDIAPVEMAGRWNIAPTQSIAIVRQIRGTRELTRARWGLLPAWIRHSARTPLLINARSETIAEKPAFRDALRHRRCLVPVDGFFEWAPPPEGAPRRSAKQPYWFRMLNDKPFALAGLWEGASGADEPPSATLITTEANACVAPVHDRMPVILPSDAYEAWLSPLNTDPRTLLKMLQPYPAALMTATPVNVRLNAARYDDESLVEPAEPIVQTRLF